MSSSPTPPSAASLLADAVDAEGSPVPGIVPLGEVGADGEKRQIGVENRLLDRGLLCTGRAGSGKTELLAGMAPAIARSGYPLVVFDPQGALCDTILDLLVKYAPERASDIVFLDLGNTSAPVAYNPLDVGSREEIEPVVAAVSELLRHELSLAFGVSPVGERALHYPATAVTALCEANLHLPGPLKLGLTDLVPFLLNQAFRQTVVMGCNGMMIEETFGPGGAYEQFSDKSKAEMVQPIVRLAAAFRREGVLGGGANRLVFDDLIARNAIVLLRGASHGLAASGGRRLLNLALPHLLSRLLRLSSEPEWHGLRVLIDEAPKLVHPVSLLLDLLPEARLYDLGVALAAQSPSQFDSGVGDYLLANTASTLSFSLGASFAGRMDEALGVPACELAALRSFRFFGNVWVSDGDGGRSSGTFYAQAVPSVDRKLTIGEQTLRDSVVARSRTYCAEAAVNEGDAGTERQLEIMAHLIVAQTQ